MGKGSPSQIHFPDCPYWLHLRRRTPGDDGKPEDGDTAVTCKDIVSDIIGGRPVSDNPEAALHTLFALLAVLPSVQPGLIDAKNLTLSGDGTAVISHASPYGRHLSSCSKTCPYQGGCARHYSDPDAVHDNIPTYELLERWDINALVDINGRAKSSPDAPKGITFDKTGHPLCPAGHKMCPWGNDPIKDAHKYRCPLKCGRIDSCPHAQQCSPGDYGRTVYIKNHGDLRFHPRIPRDSEKYRQI